MREPQKTGWVSYHYHNLSPHMSVEPKEQTLYTYTCILSPSSALKRSRLENIVVPSHRKQRHETSLQAIHCVVPVTPVRWWKQKTPPIISPAATTRDDHQGLFFSSTWTAEPSYQPCDMFFYDTGDQVGSRKKNSSSNSLLSSVSLLPFFNLFAA